MPRRRPRGEPALNFENRDELFTQLNGIRALHGRDARLAMSRSEEVRLFMQAFHGIELSPFEAERMTRER